MACAIAALAVVGSGSARAAGGKEIDSVASGNFAFGPMAIGQSKDLDHARAEGLGLVPPLPLDAYLNGVLADLLGQSPVREVPAKVYLRASGDWSARSTADANIFVSPGILLPPDPSVEAIAAAVLRLSPALALAMRAACERRARTFSRECFLSAFENLLQR